MKKIILILVFIISIISCKTDTKKAAINESSETEQKQETPQIALGEFDIKAGDFVDKEIQLKGIVDHICKHGGKKILLVTDEGDAHVFSDERFDDALKGSEIRVNGIVLEERIDETYLLKMEENNIKSHSEGKSNKEQFENRKKHAQQYRNMMKADSVDYISNFSLKYISHTEID